MSEGKVYLTGGGCGDEGLLTLKAREALKSCDAVVYDSLVSDGLLRWTRPDCERIFVGKRCGAHSRTQPEINALLIKKAREGKTVVRLKGGDPYVFGRGGEEFLAMCEAGICCEEIPGVTSAIAVPAAAGIPVTHRGLSDSVTVVTGSAADSDGQGGPQLDYRTLARLGGTLVILMGMRHLSRIAAGLLAAGKDPDTPCAIVMEATTGRQRVVRAALSEITERAARQGFTSPAVIVVGAVAKLELTGKRTDGGLPLSGITVGVTGTARFADKLSRAVQKMGAKPLDMSFMEIRPADEALPDFSDCGWLVFTSPNGVRVFLDKMKETRRDLRSLYGKKTAVIGPGTAAALHEAGLYEDYMPRIYDAAHLAQGLSQAIARDGEEGSAGGGLVLLLRAKQGSDVLPLTLKERGVPYKEHALYELLVREEKRDAVSEKEPDYIVFGSAMGARAYFEGLEKKGVSNGRSRYVCIGEGCAKEVGKYMSKPPLIPKEAGVDAIAACLCADLACNMKGETDDVPI